MFAFILHLKPFFLPSVLLVALMALATFTPPVFALAIDWSGRFGVDTKVIENYRRTDNTTAARANANQIIRKAPGDEQKASLQSYLFRLDPALVVNDSATIQGSLSTNYGFGGRLGDSTQTTKDATFRNAAYLYNTTSADSNLTLRELYADLFSDTGHYRLGRQPFDWGLGAVYDSGQDFWDRHATIRDGFRGFYMIGNFKFSPFWFRIDSASQGLTSDNMATEYGVNLLYENAERQLSFGLLYAIKKSKPNNSYYDVPGDDPTAVNATDVKVIDLTLKKSFGDLAVGVEVPLVSGEIGERLAAGVDADYESNAIITEAHYTWSPAWDLDLKTGWVKGQSGDTDEFTAMVLNPNYQIARLLFRYNLSAVGDTSESIYDAAITNARFARLSATFQTQRWTLVPAIIWAQADEAASPSQNLSYNHEKDATFVATEEQDDSYGIEIDFDATYQWNEAVSVGSFVGYHFVGDYYAFTNGPETQPLKDTYILGVNASIDF